MILLAFLVQALFRMNFIKADIWHRNLLLGVLQPDGCLGTEELLLENNCTAIRGDLCRLVLEMIIKQFVICTVQLERIPVLINV